MWSAFFPILDQIKRLISTSVLHAINLFSVAKQTFPQVSSLGNPSNDNIEQARMHHGPWPLKSAMYQLSQVVAAYVARRWC